MEDKQLMNDCFSWGRLIELASNGEELTKEQNQLVKDLEIKLNLDFKESLEKNSWN